MTASKMADIQRQLERATGRASVAVRQSVSATMEPIKTKAPSREGKIHIGAYLDPDFKTSLRLVQARTGKKYHVVRLEPIVDSEQEIKGFMAFTTP